MDSYKGEDFEAQVTKIFPNQWIRNTKSFYHRSKFTKAPPDSIANLTLEGHIILEVKEMHNHSQKATWSMIEFCP